MSDEELQEALAARIPFTTSVLFQGPSEWPNRDERLRIAGRLLPVVRWYAAEELRAAIATVQAVYDLQCPAMPADRYVDNGAHSAHKWWETVLGGELHDLRAHAAALTAREAES